MAYHWNIRRAGIGQKINQITHIISRIIQAYIIGISRSNILSRRKQSTDYICNNIQSIREAASERKLES